MKNFLKLLTLSVLLSFGLNANAFVVSAPNAPNAPQVETQTAEQFLAVTPESYQEATGKKMKWGQRVLLKMAQKKIKRKIKKGKLKASDEAGSSGNILSLLSLVFGVVGLVSMWFVGILGLLFGLAGLILGIVALKREDSTAMALIGTITGGVVLLLWLLAIVILASIL